MKNACFFYKLSWLETSLSDEYSLDGAVIPINKLKKDVLHELKLFVESCSWTKSKHTKFIVQHSKISLSDELAKLYAKAYPNSKPKSATTFRVQRAKVSQQLFRLIGNNFADVLLGDNEEQIMELRTHIQILNSLYRGTDNYLLNDFATLITNQPSASTDSFSIDDCKKEVEFLSQFTYKSISKNMSELDINKLQYLCSVIYLDAKISPEGNEEKISVLTSIDKQINAQGTNEQDSIKDILRMMKKRLVDLKEENKSLKAEVEELKESQGDILFDNAL